MGLSSAEIYRLNIGQLREECSRLGLDRTGPVRELRRRLVQLKSAAMANTQDLDNLKASGSTDSSFDAVPSENSNLHSDSQVRSLGDNNLVFVELVRKVPPFTSEEPEAILRFVARLDDVYMLKLCEDRFLCASYPWSPE